MSDTIFARSTAPGRAGIAVVRLSGPRSHEAIEMLTRRALPPARRASLRKIWYEDLLVDQAVVIIFNEGQSFTGEMAAELHLHGSEAVVRALCSALSQQSGFRLAQAGEFTHRALANNKLDLPQIEGLQALLEAETESQRLQAMQVFSGEFGDRVAAWRETLLDALAEITVSVDFADEEVPQEPSHLLSSKLGRVVDEISEEVAGVNAAQAIQRGFQVAIVGAPNVGKSTLLNRLAGREAALTSDVAGTTRDVIEVRMEVDGQLVTFLDTAGLRETDDHVEAMGVAQAQRRANQADLRIFLGRASNGVEVKAGDVEVLEKADLRGCHDGFAVSGRTGDGVAELLDRVAKSLSERVSGAGLAFTDRQLDGLVQARVNLTQACEFLDLGSEAPELAAEEVHRAVSALDETVGKIGVEEVLGRIFSSFCIGK